MASPGFNISTFTSNIFATGIQRPSKFLVRIPLPVGLTSHPEFAEIVATNRMLEYWAETAQIPGLTLAGHQNLRYGYGAYEKKPVFPMSNDIPVTFLDDAKGAIHHFFVEWQNMIVNHDMSNGIFPLRKTGQIGRNPMDPYEISYKVEYSSDVNIVMFDDVGEETKSIVLREAYPIDVGALMASWQAANDLSRFPVVFTFHDWFSNFAPVRTNSYRVD